MSKTQGKSCFQVLQKTPGRFTTVRFNSQCFRNEQTRYNTAWGGGNSKKAFFPDCFPKLYYCTL